jgi:hypothetical protein
MQLPSVVHPKRFSINGIILEVVSYTNLTDAQAMKAAQLFYSQHKFKKKDQGKLFRALTLFDKDSLGLL